VAISVPARTELDSSGELQPCGSDDNKSQGSLKQFKMWCVYASVGLISAFPGLRQSYFFILCKYLCTVYLFKILHCIMFCVYPLCYIYAYNLRYQCYFCCIYLRVHVLISLYCVLVIIMNKTVHLYFSITLFCVL